MTIPEVRLPNSEPQKARGIVRWLGWQIKLYSRWRAIRHGGEVHIKLEITEAYQ